MSESTSPGRGDRLLFRAARSQKPPAVVAQTPAGSAISLGTAQCSAAGKLALPAGIKTRSRPAREGRQKSLIHRISANESRALSKNPKLRAPITPLPGNRNRKIPGHAGKRAPAVFENSETAAPGNFPNPTKASPTCRQQSSGPAANAPVNQGRAA